jgi:hypothetical protein
MAVRFVKPIQTPYESQFVPMPLDFMYKNMQEKQKGLDVTRGELGKANLDLDGAIWDIEQGNVAKKKLEYTSEVDKLTKMLEQNKEGYAGIAQNLGGVNKKFNNDPEVQRILKHKEYYDKNVAPYLGKPNAASLYFKGMMEEDPETGQWKWKRAQDIQLGDIRTPIEDKNDSHIMENFGKWLNASVVDNLGEGYSISQDPSGFYVIKEPGGTTKEYLDFENDYVKKAIKNYANVLKDEQSDQAQYIKEFRPNRNTGKRGISTEEDLTNYVGEVVSRRFYSKEKTTPANYQFSSPKSGGDGGDGTTPVLKEWGYTMQNMPTDITSPQTYLQLRDAGNTVTNQQVQAVKNLQDKSIDVMARMDKAIPGLGITNQVNKIYQETSDPVAASSKALQLIMTNYDKLDQANKDNLRPSISFLLKDLENINLLDQKKAVFNSVANYVDDRLIRDAIPEKELNTFKNSLTEGTVVGYDGISGSPIYLEKTLTEAQKNEVASLIAIRKTAKGGKMEWFAGEGDYKESDIDKRIADILGVPGNKSFNLETGGGFFGFGSNMLNDFYGKLDTQKVENILASGIKMDAKSIRFSKIGETDTEVEKIIEPLKQTLSGVTLNNIASSAGAANLEEFLKGTVFRDKKLSETDMSKLIFDDIQIVDHPGGGVPSALYSFKLSGEGQPVVQVLAPLVTSTNKTDISTIGKEMFVRGYKENNGDLQEMGARIFSTANLAEIDYSKILYLMKIRPDEDENITFNLLNNSNFTVTKRKEGDNNYSYTVSLPSGASKVFDNPNDIFTTVGLYQLEQIARGGQGGASVGKPPVGVKQS